MSKSKSRTATKPLRRVDRSDIPLIERPLGSFRSRHPVFDIADASLIAGMIGKNLWDFSTLAELSHASPKSHGLFGVVAGKCHEEDADMIRFGFLLAIEGFIEKHIDLPRLFARDTLIGMMCKGMADLVRHYGGELVVILRHLQDGGINGNLAAGQAKSVHPLIFNNVRFPLESVAFDMQVDFALEGLDAGRSNDLDRDRSHSPDARIIRRQDLATILTQHLTIGLLADGQFLVGRKTKGLLSVPRPLATGRRLGKTRVTTRK